MLLTARRSGRRSVGVTERRTVGRVLQLVAFGGGFLGQSVAIGRDLWHS